jgi:hypothetical protein
MSLAAEKQEFLISVGGRDISVDHAKSDGNAIDYEKVNS